MNHKGTTLKPPNHLVLGGRRPLYLFACYYYHSVRNPIRWLVCWLIMSTVEGFYEKLDIWPRSEASWENVKSLGHNLSYTYEAICALSQSNEPIIYDRYYIFTIFFFHFNPTGTRRNRESYHRNLPNAKLRTARWPI